MVESMKSVDRLMEKAVTEGIFPGGIVLASKNLSVKVFKAYGFADLSTQTRVTKHTIFDLASLTKPLATTLAVFKLIQKKRLELDGFLADVLPPFQRFDKEKITIRQLLSHHSGLPDYQPYYEILREMPLAGRRKKLRRMLVKEPLHHKPGETALYSDLGFMILNWVVETVAGQRLDRFVDAEIYAPLGLRNLFFIDLRAKRPPAEFAATERCPWRRVVLSGEVHDDNAHVLGGIEGHAGLFGTAEHTHSLLAALLEAHAGRRYVAMFPPKLLHSFFERQGNSSRALGFDMPAAEDPSCGKLFPQSAVGHLGFTGTSFWMDLEREIIVILLTNRVHPSRDNIRISAFRPLLHNAVMENLLG